MKPAITIIKRENATFEATMVKSASMELENGLHNLKVYAGCVEITNKQTGQSCRLQIDDNIQLGNLFDVLFDREGK